MRNWIAGAMTVLGVLLIVGGGGIIILRNWPKLGSDSTDGTGTVAGGEFSATPARTDVARVSSGLRTLGPPERLMGWGVVLLILAAVTACGGTFQISSSVPGR